MCTSLSQPNLRHGDVAEDQALWCAWLHGDHNPRWPSQLDSGLSQLTHQAGAARRSASAMRAQVDLLTQLVSPGKTAPDTGDQVGGLQPTGPELLCQQLQGTSAWPGPLNTECSLQVDEPTSEAASLLRALQVRIGASCLHTCRCYYHTRTVELKCCGGRVPKAVRPDARAEAQPARVDPGVHVPHMPERYATACRTRPSSGRWWSLRCVPLRRGAQAYWQRNSLPWASTVMATRLLPPRSTNTSSSSTPAAPKLGQPLGLQGLGPWTSSRGSRMTRSPGPSRTSPGGRLSGRCWSSSSRRSPRMAHQLHAAYQALGGYMPNASADVILYGSLRLLDLALPKGACSGGSNDAPALCCRSKPPGTGVQKQELVDQAKQFMQLQAAVKLLEVSGLANGGWDRSGYCTLLTTERYHFATTNNMNPSQG